MGVSFFLTFFIFLKPLFHLSFVFELFHCILFSSSSHLQLTRSLALLVTSLVFLFFSFLLLFLICSSLMFFSLVLLFSCFSDFQRLFTFRQTCYLLSFRYLFYSFPFSFFTFFYFFLLFFSFIFYHFINQSL